MTDWFVDNATSNTSSHQLPHPDPPQSSNLFDAIQQAVIRFLKQIKQQSSAYCNWLQSATAAHINNVQESQADQNTKQSTSWLLGNYFCI